MARRSPLCAPLALLLLQAPACAWAQTSVLPFAVQGTVVDSVTGKPLGRALVNSLDHRCATLTDSEGRFLMQLTSPEGSAGNGVSAAPSLSAGSLILHAQKPGYLADNDVLPDPLFRQPPLPLVIRLTPAAIIAGHVLTRTGDQPLGVEVTLLRHRIGWDRRETLEQVGSAVTDSHGAFRFSDLAPGDYTLMTHEWRGDEPRPTRRRGPFAVDSRGAETTTDRYPPVFLGDTPTLTSAGVLHLDAGETAQADLRLHRSTYFPVTIPVSTSATGMLIRGVARTPDDLSTFDLAFNRQADTVTGMLPRGRYTVSLSSPPSLVVVFPLQVGDGPVRTAPVALGPLATLSVHVHRQFTRSTGGGISVSVILNPDPAVAGNSRRGAWGSNQPGSRDDFLVSNVSPGRFRVQSSSSLGYVSAASCGGVDLLRESFTVGPDGVAAPIDVTVRDDGATVTGNVQTSAGPLPSHSYVVLLPSDGEATAREAYATADGTFTLNNVAPGQYRAVAVGGRARDPEAMLALAAESSVSVSATAGGSTHVEVPLSSAASPQGDAGASH